MDVATVAALLRDAEEHHARYEATAPAHHWEDWYAAFIVAREEGRSSDQAAAEAGRHVAAVSASPGAGARPPRV
jgi:hypothetical protein